MSVSERYLNSSEKKSKISKHFRRPQSQSLEISRGPQETRHVKCRGRLGAARLDGFFPVRTRPGCSPLTAGFLFVASPDRSPQRQVSVIKDYRPRSRIAPGV